MASILGRQFHETTLRQAPPPAAQLSVRPALAADSLFLQQADAGFILNDTKTLHLVGTVGGRLVGVVSLRDDDDGSLAISIHVAPMEPDTGIGTRMLQQAAEKMRHCRLSAAGWREGFTKLGRPPHPPVHKM